MTDDMVGDIVTSLATAAASATVTDGAGQGEEAVEILGAGVPGASSEVLCGPAPLAGAKSEVTLAPAVAPVASGAEETGVAGALADIDETSLNIDLVDVGHATLSNVEGGATVTEGVVSAAADGVGVGAGVVGQVNLHDTELAALLLKGDVHVGGGGPSGGGEDTEEREDHGGLHGEVVVCLFVCCVLVCLVALECL